MALYVGVPCGIAVQLVLDGKISTPGVLAPYSKEICDPIREILEALHLGVSDDHTGELRIAAVRPRL